MGKRARPTGTAKGAARQRAYEPDRALATRINDILAGRSSDPASVPPPAPFSITSPAAALSAPIAPVVPATHFQSMRADAPPVASKARGSQDEAAAAASTEESRRLALTKFEEEKVASSSRKSRASHWKTWQSMHRTWFRDEQYLPLTTTKIACISALFKAGKYCSFANYISRAKSEHIASFHIHGCHWTEEMNVAVRDASRSVQRGLGTSRQSSPVDIQRIYALDLPSTPLCPGGPISPKSFAVLGVFFMTREIEITCAGFSDLRMDEAQSELSWRLPVSKSDPRALGTTRTWGCVCSGDRSIVCPLHAYTDHAEVLTALAAELGVVAASLPLFPDQYGKEVTKVNAVESIVQLASRSGEATTDVRGRNLFGGHSLRTGGAVTLAGLGLDSVRIECLARWHSPMLAH